MRRSLKRCLIVALMAVASLLLLAGCSIGRPSLNEIVEENNLRAIVTYYANEGEFENSSSKKDLYYMAGVQPLDIREPGVTANISIERDGYDFIAWYHAEVDGDGNIIFEDGKPKASDTMADFTKYLVEGDHWTLVAKWKIQSRVRIQIVGKDLTETDKIVIKTEEDEKVYDKEYALGDELISYPYEVNNKVKKPDVESDSFVPQNEYTFVEFYSDKDCTNVCQWPIERGDEDVIVYARYIKGNWKFIRTLDDLSQISNGVMSRDKYLLLNDIDCQGKSITAMGTKSFAGTLQGDGKAYTIKNLTVIYSVEKQEQSASVFGNIKSTATIKDIYFENISVEYTTAYITENQVMEIPVYLLYTSLASGATVQNVTFSGAMKVVYEGTAYKNTNIAPDGNGGWTGWLAGTTATGAEDAKAGFNTDGMTITVEGYPQE